MLTDLGTLMLIAHVTMLPSMFVAMLLRPEEYCVHRVPPDRLRQVLDLVLESLALRDSMSCGGPDGRTLGRNELLTGATSTDVLVRSDGGWRYQAHHVSMDGPAA